MKNLKITEKQLLTASRSASREIEIANNLRINHHRVHKSKRAYTRKPKHSKLEY